MEFNVNHPILFILVGVIILFVLAQSVFFLLRAWRRAKEKGMDMKVLKKTVSSAAIFTIAPAVAILVGVVALSKILGIALPWSATVSYFLFLVLSLALQFVLFYFAMNRVSLVYAAAYEALLAEFEEKKAKLRSRVNVPVKSRSNPWNDQY